jgi:hypothetical protein
MVPSTVTLGRQLPTICSEGDGPYINLTCIHSRDTSFTPGNQQPTDRITAASQDTLWKRGTNWLMTSHFLSSTTTAYLVGATASCERGWRRTPVTRSAGTHVSARVRPEHRSRDLPSWRRFCLVFLRHCCKCSKHDGVATTLWTCSQPNLAKIAGYPDPGLTLFSSVPPGEFPDRIFK